MSNFRISLGTILILILIPIPLTLVPIINKVLAQSLSNYTDPDGNYALQYPSDWHTNGPKNLGNHMPLILTIGPKYTGSNLIQMIISVVASEKNQNVSLESLKNLSMIINSQDLPTFHVIEDASYNKYKIDNYPAVSYTFGYDDTPKMKELYVGSKINNTVFHIGYAAPQNEYDQFLPSVEKTLSTMRALRAN